MSGEDHLNPDQFQREKQLAKEREKAEAKQRHPAGKGERKDDGDARHPVR